jgi:hypothetical protein
MSDKTLSDGHRPNTLAEIESCQQELARAEERFRALKYHLLGRAYCAARALEDDVTAWGIFIEDKFWSGFKLQPTANDRHAPLKAVVQYVFSAQSKSRRKAASKYARALKGLGLTDETADQIAKRLRDEGGIEKLARTAAQADPKKIKKRRDAVDGNMKRHTRDTKTDRRSTRSTSRRHGGRDESKTCPEAGDTADSKRNTTRATLRLRDRVQTTVESLASGARVKIDARFIGLRRGRPRFVAFRLVEAERASKHSW